MGGSREKERAWDGKGSKVACNPDADAELNKTSDRPVQIKTINP